MHHLKELIEIFRLTISSKKCHIFGRLAALRGVKTHVPVRFKGKGAYHRDRNILKATISHITSDSGQSTDPLHRCVLRAQRVKGGVRAARCTRRGRGACEHAGRGARTRGARWRGGRGRAAGGGRAGGRTCGTRGMREHPSALRSSAWHEPRAGKLAPLALPTSSGIILLRLAAVARRRRGCSRYLPSRDVVDRHEQQVGGLRTRSSARHLDRRKGGSE